MNVVEVNRSVTVRDAAARLGIGERQVRNLVHQGVLHRHYTGLIDAQSLTTYANRHRTAGRAWAEATAWGAIALLSGTRPTWMGSSQRSRLKGTLKTLTATDLAARARNRATVHRLTGLDSAVARAAHDIVDTGRAATRLGLTSTRRIEGYLAAADLDRLTHRYRLRPAPDGPLTLHATGFDLDVVRALAHDDIVVTALDLADSADTRERTAGLDALNAALTRLRRG